MDLDRVQSCFHFSTSESAKEQGREHSGDEGKVSGRSTLWPPSFLMKVDTSPREYGILEARETPTSGPQLFIALGGVMGHTSAFRNLPPAS